MTIQDSTTLRRWFPGSAARNRHTEDRTLRRAAWFAAIFVLSILATTVVEAADYQVITNASLGVDSISKRDLTRVFLKQRTRWASGEYAKPIDQKMKNEIRATFSEGTLGRSLADVESFWNSQVFSGKSTPPPTASSDQEVIDFVKKTPGAVGYVAAEADISGTKVINVVD
jgi:ABC-type phosphate transport system substrate-binding protein